ncbi:MAG: hypothetical protein M5R36_05140 [Deltaproteobacteria bacterium]|nr:hypothetical protein [Deltaproteobacteria bacterium]
MRLNRWKSGLLFAVAAAIAVIAAMTIPAAAYAADVNFGGAPAAGNRILLELDPVADAALGASLARHRLRPVYAASLNGNILRADHKSFSEAMARPEAVRFVAVAVPAGMALADALAAAERVRGSGRPGPISATRCST